MIIRFSPLVEVRGVLREAEDGHDLRGGRDVEAVATREAVRRAAEADDDVPEGAVVEVDDALPGDATGVDLQRVAEVEMVVDHRRQQVVRLRHAVHVAGEVQVDVLRGDHLGIPAAGGAALHAKVGAKGRLADAERGLLAQAVDGVGEADGDSGLAFAAAGRRDRCDEEKLAVRLVDAVLEDGERQLGDVLAVKVDAIGIESERAGDFADRQLLEACSISRFVFTVGVLSSFGGWLDLLKKAYVMIIGWRKAARRPLRHRAT